MADNNTRPFFNPQKISSTNNNQNNQNHGYGNRNQGHNDNNYRKKQTGYYNQNRNYRSYNNQQTEDKSKFYYCPNQSNSDNQTTQQTEIPQTQASQQQLQPVHEQSQTILQQQPQTSPPPQSQPQSSIPPQSQPQSSIPPQSQPQSSIPPQQQQSQVESSSELEPQQQTPLQQPPQNQKHNSFKIMNDDRNNYNNNRNNYNNNRNNHHNNRNNYNNNRNNYNNNRNDFNNNRNNYNNNRNDYNNRNGYNNRNNYNNNRNNYSNNRNNYNKSNYGTDNQYENNNQANQQHNNSQDQIINNYKKIFYIMSDEVNRLTPNETILSIENIGIDLLNRPQFETIQSEPVSPMNAPMNLVDLLIEGLAIDQPEELRFYSHKTFEKPTVLFLNLPVRTPISFSTPNEPGKTQLSFFDTNTSNNQKSIDLVKDVLNTMACRRKTVFNISSVLSNSFSNDELSRMTNECGVVVLKDDIFNDDNTKCTSFTLHVLQYDFYEEEKEQKVNQFVQNMFEKGRYNDQSSISSSIEQVYCFN